MIHQSSEENKPQDRNGNHQQQDQRQLCIKHTKVRAPFFA